MKGYLGGEYPFADLLVQAAADAINEETRRELSGEDPTGGHGYFAPGIVAAVAVLRKLGHDGAAPPVCEPCGPRCPACLADLIVQSWCSPPSLKEKR